MSISSMMLFCIMRVVKSLKNNYIPLLTRKSNYNGAIALSISIGFGLCGNNNGTKFPGTPNSR